MISTPLLTSHSARQRQPHGGWAAAVLLLGAKGVSAFFRGNIFVTEILIAGIISAFVEPLTIDQLTQSGWCRRSLAPT